MNDPRLTRIGTSVPAPPAAERTRFLVRGTIAPRFIDARAVSADDAIAFIPANEREQRALARMIGDGSIRMAAGGRLWFDMSAYENAAHARERRMLPWLVAVPILIAALATMFYLNGSVSRW